MRSAAAKVEQRRDSIVRRRRVKPRYIEHHPVACIGVFFFGPVYAKVAIAVQGKALFIMLYNIAVVRQVGIVLVDVALLLHRNA